MKTDLHMHSAHSLDGELSVTELAEICHQYGVETLSLTDHNSVAGIDEMAIAASRHGMGFIPGIEIDCIYNGIDLHVLGYNIDWKSTDLVNLEPMVHQRIEAAFPEMIRLLEKTGITVDPAEVRQLAQGRPPCAEQIAEALVTNPVYHSNPKVWPYLPGGSRGDMPFINFYLDYFAQGRPAYAGIEYMSFADAIELIRNNGGMPIVAHPGVNLRNREEVIHELLKKGAAGLEAFNNYHEPEQIRYFAKAAAQHDRLVTCGSDFHGKNKPLIKPGSYRKDDQYSSVVQGSIQVLMKREHC